MASIITNKGLSLLSKSYWESPPNAIRVALLSSSATPNKDWDFMNDITNELAVGGYARTTVGTKTATIDNANDRVDYDIPDLDFGVLSASAVIRYAAIYEDVAGADSGKPLIAVVQFGADFTTNGTLFRAVWSDPLFRATM